MNYKAILRYAKIMFSFVNQPKHCKTYNIDFN